MELRSLCVTKHHQQGEQRISVWINMATTTAKFWHNCLSPDILGMTGCHEMVNMRPPTKLIAKIQKRLVVAPCARARVHAPHARA